MFDTTGRLIYHFASQLDVTKRREAEAVLQQSQRMETLGSMASSLAHEFNNLMTIVLANLDQVVRAADIDAKTADKVRQAVDKAEKLDDQGETASALDQLNNAVRRLDDSEGQATLKQALEDLIGSLS